MATSVHPLFLFDQKDVTTAGTAVALGGTHPIKALILIAHDDNTGRIFYGDQYVSSATQRGLAAGLVARFP